MNDEEIDMLIANAEYEPQQLKDYITNLQQENEYLNKHQRFHKKFGNDYIFCAEGDKETYKDLLLEKQEELEDYKSRIEKAIPMLKELNIKMKGILNTGIDIKEISDIEETLNGRSDENE